MEKVNGISSLIGKQQKFLNISTDGAQEQASEEAFESGGATAASELCACLLHE